MYTYIKHHTVHLEYTNFICKLYFHKAGGDGRNVCPVHMEKLNYYKLSEGKQRIRVTRKIPFKSAVFNKLNEQKETMIEELGNNEEDVSQRDRNYK